MRYTRIPEELLTGAELKAARKSKQAFACGKVSFSAEQLDALIQFRCAEILHLRKQLGEIYNARLMQQATDDDSSQ